MDGSRSDFIIGKRIFLKPLNSQLSIGSELFPEARKFVVREKVAGNSVGEVNYCSYSPSQGKVEIGIEILPPQRGKGYGREALSCFLRYLFLTMKVWKVVLAVAVNNSIAQNLYSKLGFELEEKVCNGAYDPGKEKFIDILIMRLSRERWSNLQS